MLAAVNRRLDEWVTKERLNFDEVTKPEPASKNEEVGAMPGSVCAIGHSTQRRLCVIVVFVFYCLCVEFVVSRVFDLFCFVVRSWFVCFLCFF